MCKPGSESPNSTALRSRVIIGITFAPHGADRADITQPLRIADRRILDTTVRMMNELITDLIPRRPDRHLQRIEGKLSPQRIRDLPPDNPAGKQISDKRGINKTAGRIHIRDTGGPARPR
jgi:hypothetical protein